MQNLFFIQVFLSPRTTALTKGINYSKMCANKEGTMTNDTNSSIFELFRVIEDMGPCAQQKKLISQLDNDPKFNQYAENTARQTLPFFRYTDNPELYRLMKPYEDMCRDLLSAAMADRKTYQSYKGLKQLRLRTSFGDLPFSLVAVSRFNLYRGYLVVSLPTIESIKKQAQTSKQFYSDDMLAFAMAHECGHADQQMRNRTPEDPIQSELLADEFGAHLVCNAGYSLYEAIRTLPTITSEIGSKTHPPISERCLHLIQYGLENDLFSKEDLPDVYKFQKDLKKRIQEKARLTNKLFANKSNEEAVVGLILKNKHIFHKDDISNIISILSEDTNKRFLSAPQLIDQPSKQKAGKPTLSRKIMSQKMFCFLPPSNTHSR